MFGKFHRYNSRNREYIQTSGIEDLLIVDNGNNELSVVSKTDINRKRVDTRSQVTNGLIGWWRIDEGTGSFINDSSGFGSHGIINSTVNWTPGYLGKTAEFQNNGSNYINITPYVSNFNQLSQASFSVVFWFRITASAGSQQTFISLYESTTANKFLTVLRRPTSFEGGIFANMITFAFWANDGHSTTTITDNKWHHFAGTYGYNGTTGTRRIYIDGTLESTENNVNPLNFSPNTFRLANFDVSSGLDGCINDMRIYNRALTAGEVSTIYNTLDSGKISKLTSNISSQYTYSNPARNTNTLIYSQPALFNNMGIVGPSGNIISSDQPTRMDSLVAWWPLNEGSGTAAYDKSGQNNTLSYSGTGGAIWENDPEIGPYFSMDNNDRLETRSLSSVNNLRITTAFTVCLWAKSNTATWNNFGMLMNNRVAGTTNATFMLHPNSGATTVTFFSSGINETSYTLTSASIIDITKWTHYCGVYDGNEFRLYINGIQDPTIVQNTVPLLPVSNPVYLGYDISGGTPRYLNGGLTDARVYNTALTCQEIISIMEERKQLTPRNINANLIAWWPCNDGYDGQIMDYSGGNRHCTLQNNPVIQYTGPNGSKSLNLDSTKSQWANTVTTYSLSSDFGVTNKFTVSVWLKSAGTTWNVDGAGVSHRSQSGSSYVFIMHPNAGTKTMTFYIVTTAGGSITSPAVNDITIWHHYVGVYDGSYLRLYIDGVQVATPVARVNNVASTSLPIRLGGDYNSSNRYLNGEVSDVRLFNIALEPEEVSSLYNATYTNYTNIQTCQLVPQLNPDSNTASNKTLQLQLTGQAFTNTTFVTDYSGNHRHANIPIASSVSYSTVTVISGVGPRSLAFNGTTGYLICDGTKNNGWAYKGVLGQTPRSFTCWLYPPSSVVNRPILSYGSGTGQSRGLFDIFLDTAGNVNVNLDNSGSSYVIKWDTRLQINTWQHLSITLDKYGMLKCYKGTTSQPPSMSNIATIINGLDTSALQAWLPFDDSFNNSRIAYDKSGNGNNGTLSSSAYLAPGFGKFGNNVLYLSGSSAVTTSYLPALNSVFSWSIWIYPTTQSVEQPIISVTNNNGFWEASEFVYEIASDNILKIGQNGAFGVGSTGPLIQSNTWTHLGLTYNGSGTYNIYVNGVLSTTRANTSLAGPVGSTLTFGRYDSGTSPSSTYAFFKGYMADFRAYNTALDANQVANLYYNNLTAQVNTPFTFSSNLQIGRGVASSPYSSTYYAGYMDDIRLYEGALLQSDIVNIWNGGLGSNSQVTPITSGIGIDLGLIPLQGSEYSVSSAGYQAPALLASGFGTLFSNKTITFTPTSTTNYTWSTTNTVSWPPDSITGHTKVYFGAGQIDDAKFDLTGSNVLVNQFTYYGNSYTYIGVCTNGHFSVGVANDTNYSPTYANHYLLRRISMFFNDLMVTSTENPNGVYYGFKTESATNDVCVVTYYGIANLNNTASRSNCQVKLYLNNSSTPGRIVMSFGTVQATNAIVGISNGSTPTDGISQGANLAASANTAIINYNANTAIIPDSIFATNTTLYNFSPAQINAFYYGIDSNTTSFYLRSGLVGWWKLDEQSGNTYFDISGTNQNGTFTGTTSSIQRMVGPYNTTCLNLEGDSRYISVYNGGSFPVTTSNLSISAWFNCSNISASRAILGLNTTGGLDRLPVFITTSGTIQVLNGTTSITSTIPVPVGSWNHLCITATSSDPVSNIRVYINSQLYASSTTSNTFASNDKLFIGSELDTATYSDFYIGQIADVRLYNRKLSDNDVLQLYNWSPGLTTQTATGTYALDLFGSQTSLSYSRRVEYTPPPGNSNAIAVACWVEPMMIGIHTIASSKSTGDRTNGDWEFQLVSPGHDSLIGWWLLNEGTGTTCYNLASTNYNGTITGSTSWLDAPRGNKAMTFNGSSTYVTLDSGSGSGLASALAGDVFSASAWFYPTTVSVQQMIIGINSNNGNNNSMLVFISGTGFITVAIGSDGLVTTRAITVNTWNFVAVTVTGLTYNIYHNSGIPFVTGTLTSPLIINTTDKCYIGMELDGASTSDFFNGQIADVRMWNRVLTQTEIHDIYYGNQYLYGSITIDNTLYTVYDKTPMALNKWYHVGFQYNSRPAILSLFLDGIQVQQTQLSYITAGQPALTSSNIVIGAINRSSGTLSQYFQGRISDFKQYNNLLPPVEYTKLAYGHYQQSFRLDTSTIPSSSKYSIDCLADAGTKFVGSGGQAGSTYVNVYGNMIVQQPGPHGNELIFDGINDYLDISSSYLTKAYNRVFSLGGWVMPAPGPEFSPVVDINMADVRRNMAGIVYNGYIYVIGGYSGSGFYNYAGRFDGTTWIAETTRTFTTGREACAVALYGNLIYMVGGWNGSALTSVVTYNGTNWVNSTSINPGIFNHSCATLGSFLYSIGGNTGSELTANVNRFNGTSWSSAPALNIPRDGASSVLYNGKIYCIGGRINLSNNEATATVEVFDGMSWTFGPSLTGPRSNFMCCTDGRYIYAISGIYNFNNDTQNSFTIERFDGIRWQLLPYQTNITRITQPAVFYNNRIYMMGGGINQSGSILNSVEYMSIPTDTGAVQSYATSTTETIRSAGHCIYNSQLYIIGGFTGSVSVNTVKRWDGVNWTDDSGNIGTARYSIGCAVFGNFIYIVGGFNGTTYYNIVQRYSISTGWVTMNVYPLSVASVSLVVYNGKLYGIGGNTAATTQTANIYVYNNSTDSWSVVTTLTTARTETSCMVYNNNVHICGGVNGSTALSTTEIFNGWTARTGPALAGTCRGGFGITINGFAYIFGGIYAGTSSSGTIQRYDDISWSTTGQTLLVGRHYASGGFVNNRLYLTGGIRSGGTTISTTELIQVSSVIMSKANNTTYTCYALSYDYILNSYVFEVGIGEDRVYISAPALRYQYSHVMAVCSGNDGVISLYLNGILAKSLALTEQLSYRGLINISSNVPVLIGKRTGDDGSLFAGKLTDIRFYEMALTGPKIKAMLSAETDGTIIIPQDMANMSETLAKYPRLANGLICWLSGEDIPTSGTKITDHSGQNIRGILQGNTTSAQGRFSGSKSIIFDGTGDFINIVQPSQINLKQSALSVAFWFKFTNASALATESIFSLRGDKSTGNSFDIYRASGTNQVIADFYEDTDITSPQVINNTNWHHFIVTFNGGQTAGTRRTYIDGVLLSQVTNGRAWLNYSITPSTCYIGNNSDNNYFNGQLEDFRIYNRELSQSEIKLLYGTGIQPLYNTASIQQISSTSTQLPQITRYVFNNKGQVINIPLPNILRDNLICHYQFSRLASRVNNGLDGDGRIPDENWRSKPLANYKASSYLSNLNITIPYNPANINNTQITGSGLYFDTTANLDIVSGLILNNSRDWSMTFFSQIANTSANLSLVTYTAGTTANNTTFFVNVSNNNELVYRVGVSTDYNTGCYLETGTKAHLALTKGTICSTSNVISLYKDGSLAYRKQITLNYDGTSNIKLGPVEGYMDDFRIYSSQLTSGQIATISGSQDISGPAHHWSFDPVLINPSATPSYGSNIIIDMGSSGIPLALSNVTIQNRFTNVDINSSNIAIGPGCASFNGTTSFAQAQTPGILRDNPRSILFWMRLASNVAPVNDQRLIDYGDAGNVGCQFAISRNTASKIAVSTGSSGQTVLSSQAINDTAWHHIGVIVLPPGNNTIGNIGTTRNIRIYVDGVNTTDMTTLGSTLLQTYKTANSQIDWITIGKANNANVNYYAGLLDDIRIYDVTLTPTEITGLYNKWV